MGLAGVQKKKQNKNEQNTDTTDKSGDWNYKLQSTEEAGQTPPSVLWAVENPG